MRGGLASSALRRQLLTEKCLPVLKASVRGRRRQMMELPVGSVASIAMLMGYAILAVPTGIVTIELGLAHGGRVSTQACPECSAEGHAPRAKDCNRCGAEL